MDKAQNVKKAAGEDEQTESGGCSSNNSAEGLPSPP